MRVVASKGSFTSATDGDGLALRPVHTSQKEPSSPKLNHWHRNSDAPKTETSKCLSYLTIFPNKQINEQAQTLLQMLDNPAMM